MAEQFRVVRIDMDAPFEVADDEQVIDKRPAYQGDAPVWHLLVVKGRRPEDKSSDLPRIAQLDEARKLAQALAAAATAFAGALAEPRTRNPEMC